MDPLQGLIYGLSVAFTPENLLAALVGALAGTLIGLLPGLGPVAAIAILMPVTLTLPPSAGLIMIAGIYYGTMYGGSTTAVLLNIPGEASSVIAATEGYPMAKRGRAGAALGIMALGSFFAGITATILVTVFSPFLSRVGLLFHSAEFFALTLGGLILLARVFSNDLISGMVPMVAGLAIGTVGAEGVTGRYRFTLGSLDLLDGVSIVAVAVGVFGIAEIMRLVRDRTSASSFITERIRLREMVPNREELRRSVPSAIRGTGTGFLFGLMPGPSATLAAFASYKLERSVSKFRHEMGGTLGTPEGLAGPESANNAAATSSIIPVLALGIPFSATLALMIDAMLSQGITPGPLLATQHPDIFWGVIASMLIGNVMLFVLNVPFIGVWLSILRVRPENLLPVIGLMCMVGAYSVNQSMMDVYLVVALGVAGYFLHKFGFVMAPMLVGVILGPLIENHLREGLVFSGGDVSYLFISSPIVIVIWAGVLVSLVWAPVRRMILRRQGRRTSAPVLGGRISGDED